MLITLQQAKNLKAQGVKAGVSDVLLLIPKRGILVCAWSSKFQLVSN